MVQSVSVVILTTKNALLPKKCGIKCQMASRRREDMEEEEANEEASEFGAPALGAASEFLSVALVSHPVVVVVAIWNSIEQVNKVYNVLLSIFML